MSTIVVDLLSDFNKNFENNTALHVAQRAVTKNNIAGATQNSQIVSHDHFVFSVDVDKENVANQNKSGRCWMFSCLNTLRHHIQTTFDISGSFELSQNYTFFYDKLEKANYFIENILQTAHLPIGDPKVQFLLQTPQQDGGDWCLITAIVDKYGVVPKSQMGETACSIDSSNMDALLNRQLRQDALKLRTLVSNGATKEEIAAERKSMLKDIYNILAVCLGCPPETFTFEYRDSKGQYHIDQDLTPKEFYKKYVSLNLQDYVGVINVPVDYMPYNTLFGVELSGNMVGGRPNRYVNVDMDTLKEVTIKQLQDGLPVWFGCDVLQDADFKLGVLDLDLYNLEEAFDLKYTMSKGDNFTYRQSLPTHAMVIAGVDLVEGKPTYWKIENSWGPEKGDKGYFIMSDPWMDKYTYEVVVNKKYLSQDLQKVLEQEPEMLPFWNAMNPIA